MNILLCIPPVINNWTDDWYISPVGGISVSAYLRRKFNVIVLDLTFYDYIGQDKLRDSIFSKMKDAIVRNNIDIVMCGDLVVNWAALKQVIDTAKQIKKSVITIMGGGG